MKVEECVCLKDFERLAREKLSDNAHGFYSLGSSDEQTLQENCEAFKKWRFRPRVLRNVSNVDMSSSILGERIAFPVCVAPTSLNKLASKNGEIDSAKAAHAVGTGFTLSSLATTKLEEIPSSLKWFQVYILKDKELTKRMVKSAENNGYKALILTVDSPILGIRYKNMRNKVALPPNMTYSNLEDVRVSKNDHFDLLICHKLSWEDFDWLKSITKLPIIAKGILTAEAALEALDHGVDGILVSNHGGRQLDGVLATINALPEVVKAVNGRCEVYLDGGIRNGGDVAKAIALGARAVFVGRPVLWGLACDGEAGARRVLEILRDEFEMTMKLLGVRSIAELQSVPNLVVHESSIVAKF